MFTEERNTAEAGLDFRHAEGRAGERDFAGHGMFESEQLRSRDFYQSVDHPAMGEITLPGPPFRMSEDESRPGRAPSLGEHNEELYCEEMGLSRRDLARLRAARVV